MQFSKALRPRIRSGEITSSVRIWKQPRVKVGGRYAMPPGEIEVTSIESLSPEDLSDALARETGFPDLDQLLRVARHGRGESLFLVSFVYYE